MSQDKLRAGVRVSEFPPAPSLLEKKPKRYTVLVGDDPAQVRFVEQLLDTRCQSVASLTDSELLAENSTHLFQIASSRMLDVSPNLRTNVGLWSLDPIEKGSSGANAIVRYSATLLKLDKPDKVLIQRTADILASEEVLDLRVAVWTAVGLLCGDAPEEFKRWPEPWEDPIGWMKRGVEPAYRLHCLYKDLRGYTFIKGTQDKDTLRKADVFFSPSKIKVFTRLTLDVTKVHDTLYTLSQWRNLQYDPYLCAFRVSKIWDTKTPKT